MKKDLDQLKQEVEAWKDTSGQLVEICGGPASVKVTKQKYDLESLLEEIEEEFAKQQTETDLKTSKAENYDAIFQVFN